MIKEFLANPIYLKYTICYLVSINIFGFNVKVYLTFGSYNFDRAKTRW